MKQETISIAGSALWLSPTVPAAGSFFRRNTFPKVYTRSGHVFHIRRFDCMSLQNLKAVSRFISIPLLFLICQTNLTVASDEMDFDKLVDIARRYNCPQPQESNQLVIGWGGSWRSIGQSNSQDAGIYRPAFVLEKAGKTTNVLMGFATASCKSRKNIPATRDFILSSPDEGEDGYTISHNHVSSFETCIQLGWRSSTRRH